MMKKLVIVGITLFTATAVIAAGEKYPETLTTSINPELKTIAEDSAEPPSRSSRPLEMLREAGKFLRALPSIFNPSVKYVRIKPGLRKEEIALIMQKELSWENGEKEKFLAAAPAKEGMLYPDVYFLPRGANGEVARALMVARFETEVAGRYGSSTRKIVPLETALKIASIIEREAGGETDMRLVSGVIWNRLFREMSLDMDATLQYVKGSETAWWPKVLPSDKRIDSPYNTYLYEGLPPSPIANPGLSSINAALFPEKSDYVYYIHDRYGRFHGAKNYKEHLKNIERYLK